MADIELVIKIPEEEYNLIKNSKSPMIWAEHLIAKGTVLPKGHKRLIEDNFEVGPIFDKEGNRIGYHYVTQEDLNNAPTVIEADNKYEAKAITRGNCMMCGKELSEGLFFCKECEDKGNSGK